MEKKSKYADGNLIPSLINDCAIASLLCDKAKVIFKYSASTVQRPYKM